MRAEEAPFRLLGGGGMIFLFIKVYGMPPWHTEEQLQKCREELTHAAQEVCNLRSKEIRVIFVRSIETTRKGEGIIMEISLCKYTPADSLEKGVLAGRLSEIMEKAVPSEETPTCLIDTFDSDSFYKSQGTRKEAKS